MLFVLAITIISLSLADDVSRCPASIKANQYVRAFRDRCYEFAIYREVYWEDASKDCIHKGGSLATVNDLATQKFFENSLSSLKSTRHGIWIGLNDRASEAHYTWVSGEQTTFTYWASGEPSILHSLEDCVLMRSSEGYHWEDQPCNLWPKHYSYICQYDMLPTTTMTTSTTSTTTTTPTTITTTATTTTTTTPTTTTTTTTTTTSTPCQLLSCTLDCSLNGFKTGPDGCPICTCDSR
ncbi:lectin BRA-3-like [Haliotis asinina]|uniref:lectin BRA-3-like n=1 Tax=Haliotis asinina TaxID=109174 RepID=UPI003532580E